MEFLGIGYQEILLVLVLLLVVVGPERMPAMAYQIGRAVRTLQRYARVVRDEFKDEFEYIDEQYRTVKGEIDTAGKTLREEQRRMENEWRTSQAAVESDVRSALPPAGEGPPGSSGATPGALPGADRAAGETADEAAPARQDRPPLVF